MYKTDDYLIIYDELDFYLSKVILFPVRMMKVETVSVMLTNLSCIITQTVPGDQVLLVLWYKDGYGKPIYQIKI